MTVQEAIEAIKLDGLEINGKLRRFNEFVECLVVAEEALKKQIALDKVIERLEEEKSNLTTLAEDEAYKLAINKAIEIIKEEVG